MHGGEGFAGASPARTKPLSSMTLRQRDCTQFLAHSTFYGAVLTPRFVSLILLIAVQSICKHLKYHRITEQRFSPKTTEKCPLDVQKRLILSNYDNKCRVLSKYVTKFVHYCPIVSFRLSYSVRYLTKYVQYCHFACPLLSHNVQ